ncbi:hypothetical protein [Methylophilus sp. Leaf414]|uniref:hypothetical protein n=1 Tax=Methylophilus sp. Leaf414 TaxID=1736371 RepID=UPI0006F673F0|nr:hypothetical protein [Methylophilus sp. Leaf414]KQT34503.1 hypothetical protein ASG24_12425 [Methylophilus sp. Leaf414]
MRYLVMVLIVGLAILWIAKHRVETVQEFADKQISRATQRESAQKEESRIKEVERKNSTLVKVLVKAKDIRTCLKEANTRVIDNSIIECNKDHYIEVRSDEAEKMKE